MTAVHQLSLSWDGATLERFVTSNAPAKFLQGPVGSGKSTVSWHALLLNASQKQPRGPKGLRRRRTAIIRNTYKNLIDTVIPTCRLVMPEDVWGPITVAGRPRRVVRVGDLDWEMLFYAMDKDDDVKDLKSLELSDAYTSEYRYLPRAIVVTLGERVGRFPPHSEEGCACPQLLGETNAPSPDHWSAVMSGQCPVPDGLTMDERRMLVRPEGWQFYVQPPALLEVRDAGGDVSGYVENPAAENRRNLRPGYYTQIVAGKSRVEIETELLNRPAVLAKGDPVWRQFRRETHVAKAPVEALAGHPVLIGQDFGRTPASIFGQYVFGQWRILAELGATGVGARLYARDHLKPFLAQRFPGFDYAVFGDPAGDNLAEADEISPFKMFRAEGVSIRKAPSNDPTVRIGAVEAALTQMAEGAPGLLVSPNCLTLIQAMAGSYRYAERQSGAGESVTPVKDKWSHYADALQYLVLGGGGGHALVNRPVVGLRRGPVEAMSTTEYAIFG